MLHLAPCPQGPPGPSHHLEMLRFPGCRSSSLGSSLTPWMRLNPPSSGRPSRNTITNATNFVSQLEIRSCGLTVSVPLGTNRCPEHLRHSGGISLIHLGRERGRVYNAPGGGGSRECVQVLESVFGDTHLPRVSLGESRSAGREKRRRTGLSMEQETKMLKTHGRNPQPS